MELDQVKAAVKAALALNSNIVGVGDVKEDTTLQSVGLKKTQLAGFKKDLHRLLTTALEEPVPLKKFSANLKVVVESSVREVAERARDLVVPLPVCSTIQPLPPTVADCHVWMTRSFFCRVRRAVQRWADPASIPAFGVTPDMTLGSLVPNFEDGERLRLVQATNQENVFQPFNVSAADPGSGKVDAGTTVHGYAKVLWDNNRTGCSIIVDFPD
ncbi:MAG: hypothetical protein U0R19_33800 [Bryobacteraceae bacterium]